MPMRTSHAPAEERRDVRHRERADQPERAQWCGDKMSDQLKVPQFDPG